MPSPGIPGSGAVGWHWFSSMKQKRSFRFDQKFSDLKRDVQLIKVDLQSLVVKLLRSVKIWPYQSCHGRKFERR